MKTDIIIVSSEGARMETALNTADKVAAYCELSPKNALHLRLLTEEMMGLMRSITRKTDGEFWIETEGNVFRLHLKVSAWLDSQKRDQLVAVSSSGRNEATRGIMGKIRSFFEFWDDNGRPAFSSPLMLGESAQMYGSIAWSMTEYRDELEIYREQKHEGAEEAWDELEKSVVSRVADDIRVSVHSDEAEMIIIKKME